MGPNLKYEALTVAVFVALMILGTLIINKHNNTTNTSNSTDNFTYEQYINFLNHANRPMPDGWIEGTAEIPVNTIE